MSQLNKDQERNPGKKRGRKRPDKKLPRHSKLMDASPHFNSHSDMLTEGTEQLDGVSPLTEDQDIQLSSILKDTLHQDRAEITRVARMVGVTENTIYRWMNGSSQPRLNHLKRLLEALPNQHNRLSTAITHQYPDLLENNPSSIREIQKDIYEQVVDLIVANEEPDTRLWQVAQAISEYALLQLDSQRQGLAIAFAQLMPPREDGIHSLHERITRGNYPWPYENDVKLYLGSGSLAGLAARSQRTQVWSSKNARQQAQVGEHEHSACSVPISRGGYFTAGVLTISSTHPDFFDNVLHIGAAESYAKLLSLAIPDNEFYPIEQLKLRPMPDLKLQRMALLRTYTSRVLTYARTHDCSRHDAERTIQQQIEREFENMPHNETY